MKYARDEFLRSFLFRYTIEIDLASQQLNRFQRRLACEDTKICSGVGISRAKQKKAVLIWEFKHSGELASHVHTPKLSCTLGV